MDISIYQPCTTGYCPSCAPERFADRPPALAGRLGEHHFAVRLGDVRSDIRVLLDGQDVTNDTYEVLAGPKGVVWGYHRNDEGRQHCCPCCLGSVCQEVRRGNVQVMIGGASGS